MPDYLQTCEYAARSAGELLLDWQSRIKAWEKAPRDLVTEADLASQQEIQRLLLQKYPDHQFLGEEDESSAATELRRLNHGYCWIVDPLDGTANYVHGLQNFSVSIALAHEGKVVAGVVYDPVTDELFSAEAGQGAQLNGRPLHCSNCQQIDQALAAASFGSQLQRDSPEIAQFIEVLLECQSLRRLGSAALNLSYLAAGRLDAYWSSSVKVWDIAAGILLVREAGGIVRHIRGGELILSQPQFAAASTEPLFEQLSAVLARIEED